MGKLSDLFVRLRLDNKQYNKELKESKSKTSAFGKGVSKIGGLIAGAFAVSAIINFGKELVLMGGIAEGVRTAFERIAPPGLMEDLQKATSGTVAELELMKRAVMSHNFKIPLEQLASLFEFATKRAQETGESVDFLVNSIVIGIGRKSPLILDNLGISAVELRQKLDNVGHSGATVGDVAKAVGDIARESMEKTGGIIDTNAIKMANLGAQWEDFKLIIAESPGFANAISRELDELKDNLEVFFSETLSRWDKFLAITDVTGKNMEILARKSRRLREEQELLNDNIDEGTIEYRNKIAAEQDAILEEINHIKTIGELKAETDELKASLDLYNISQGAELQKTLEQIVANEKLIKSLTTLRTKIREPEDRGTIETMKFQTSDFAPVVNDDTIRLTLESLKSLVTELDPITEVWGAFWDDMNDFAERGVEDMISTLAEGFGRLAVGDIGFEEFGRMILSQIGSFLSQMGKMLIAYGFAMSAFKKAFTNPVAAIAAGIALVAIGGAIGGLASKGPGGGSGGGVSGVSSFSGASGFSPQASTQEGDNKVIFELEGTKLIGVINNVGRRNAVIG